VTDYVDNRKENLKGELNTRTP